MSLQNHICAFDIFLHQVSQIRQKNSCWETNNARLCQTVCIHYINDRYVILRNRKCLLTKLIYHPVPIRRLPLDSFSHQAPSSPEKHPSAFPGLPMAAPGCLLACSQWACPKIMPPSLGWPPRLNLLARIPLLGLS